MIMKLETLCLNIYIILLGFLSLFQISEARKATKPHRRYYNPTWTKLHPSDVILPTGEHTGTVFFLHGLGGTGEMFRKALENMKDLGVPIPHPYLKLAFLTAPVRPCGCLMNPANAWFNIDVIGPNETDKWPSFEPMLYELLQFAQIENDQGIYWHRILMGGFSMGGAMSLIAGCSYVFKLGGIFALSAYLNNNSSLYAEMDRAQREFYPELFYYHGDADDIVKYEWGVNTYNRLMEKGIKGNFTTEPGLRHKLSVKEVKALFNWFSEITPEKFVKPTSTWFC